MVGAGLVLVQGVDGWCRVGVRLMLVQSMKVGACTIYSRLVLVQSIEGWCLYDVFKVGACTMYSRLVLVRSIQGWCLYNLFKVGACTIHLRLVLVRSIQGWCMVSVPDWMRCCDRWPCTAMRSAARPQSCASCMRTMRRRGVALSAVPPSTAPLTHKSTTLSAGRYPVLAAGIMGLHLGFFCWTFNADFCFVI